MATAVVDPGNSAQTLGVPTAPSESSPTPTAESTDSSQAQSDTPASSLSSDAAEGNQSKPDDKSPNAENKEEVDTTPRIEEPKDDKFDSWYWHRYINAQVDKPLNERIKDAPARLYQDAMLHRLFHDRLEALETQFSAILKLPESEIKNDGKDKVPDSETTIKWMNWQEYSVVYELPDLKEGEWKHVPEVDNNPQSIIETLVEEPPSFRPVRAVTTKQLPGAAGNKSSVDPGEVRLPVFQIRLRSPVLLKVLNEITDQLPQPGPYEHKVTFLKPFKLLTTFSKELLEHQAKLEQIHGDGQEPSNAVGPLKETESPKALEHLKLLNEFMRSDLSHIFQLREDFEKGTLRKVAFGDLWHIFRPGTTVRTPAAKQIQLYRVLRATGGRSLYTTVGDLPENFAGAKLKEQGYSPGSFIVECFYIDFDGVQYGPVNRTFQIRKYEGERDLTALPIFPLDCDPDHESIHEAMVTRGESFAVLSNPQRTAHKQYRGLTLDKHPEQVESQVIIDFQLAFLEMSDNKPQIGLDNIVDHDKRETTLGAFRCPRCTNEGCCGNDYIAHDHGVDEKEEQQFKSTNGTLLDSTEKADDLTADQKALLPFRVYGFVLRSRKWATFDIDSISDVQYTDGWHNLVIDDNVKETVLAMVENHESVPNRSGARESSMPSVDLVQGKGKGLIILLHGEPGVGKTSTAECVADHTKRPLFPVTCGDIGDNAESVENNLERNFQLAHKWGCVLLLDEADVFLKRRNDTDLTRNAIVSVFLRTLEYYSGILFLTTNRVGQIDRAFKSRIHVSLYYPKLNKAKSVQIWKNNIKRIDEEFKAQNKTMKIEKKEILKFAKEHFKDLRTKGLLNWNGRQIRNAFQTAVALASFDARRNKRPDDLMLGKQQFVRVADAAEEFDRYLLSLSQGKNDSQLAQEHRWRYDDFQNPGAMASIVPQIDSSRSPYTFMPPHPSSKSRKSERKVPDKVASSSDTDSESDASSDEEDSSDPGRRDTKHDDDSSGSESSASESEEEEKAKKRKGKSAGSASSKKAKDGKKRTSHKGSK